MGTTDGCVVCTLYDAVGGTSDFKVDPPLGPNLWTRGRGLGTGTDLEEDQGEGTTRDFRP